MKTQSSLEILVKLQKQISTLETPANMLVIRQRILALDDAIEAMREREIARSAAVKQAGEIVRFRAILEKSSRLQK